jgi:hypothetical protein
VGILVVGIDLKLNLLSRLIIGLVCDQLDLVEAELCIGRSITMDREDEGTLYVPRAGEILYRLKH